MNIQKIGPTYLSRKKMILNKIKEIKPKTILEIGCGSGDLITFCAKNYECTAIDLNRQNIKNLLNKNVRGNFICADLLDFKTRKKFDLVMCFEVIEHVSNDGEFFKRLTSLITLGGSILLSVPGKKSEWGAHDVFAGHYRRYEKEDLIELAKGSKLANIKVYSIGFPISNIFKHYTDYKASKILKRIKDRNKRKLTINSGIKTDSNGIFSLLFNNATMCPFYVAQDIFSGTSLGVNYLLCATKSK